jgi:hypothetical protein
VSRYVDDFVGFTRPLKHGVPNINAACQARDAASHLHMQWVCHLINLLVPHAPLPFWDFNCVAAPCR